MSVPDGSGGRLEDQLREHLRRLKAEGVWALPAAPATGSDGDAGVGAERVDADGAERGRPETVDDDVDAATPAPVAVGGDDSRPGERKETTIASERQEDLFGVDAIAPAGATSGETLDEVDAEAQGCVECRLHETRNNVVFGVGDPGARLMFIGEGPGRDEDLQGEPFVGRAGKLLDKIIAAIDRRREEVYITNTVKCRPPQNRNPKDDELAACEHFLLRQIALIEPEVIVLLGRVAVQAVLGTNAPLSRLRGEFRSWRGIQVMCTYHPAYLLRNPNAKGMVWEDMQMVRDRLAETGSG